MSNPFKVLDLSDDENITIVPKPAPAGAAPPKPNKPHAKPKAELRKEEEALQQKKKGPPGPRGSVPQPEGVYHPGEKSKIGLKKEPHVSTHHRADPAGVKEKGGRVFDRHSGTGRGKETKKHGAGGHNWGKPGDEAAPSAPAAADEAKPEEAAPAAAPEPEEDPKMTLEEFEALKQQKRSGKAFEQKEVRKVVAEPSLAVLKKSDEADERLTPSSVQEPHEKKKPAHFKAKPTKQVVEIEFKMTREPEPTESSSRGGRGFGRGGRNNGPSRGSPRADQPAAAPRGGRSAGPRQAPVDIADVSAFPKLGGA